MYSNIDKYFLIFFFSLSIALEILLYFLITDSLKLSRILQYIIILFIVFSLFLRKKIIFNKLPFNRFIGFYLLFIFFIYFIFLLNNLSNIDAFLRSSKQVIIYLYYLFIFIVLKILIINNKEKFIYFVKFIRKTFIYFLYLGFILYFVKYFFDVHLINKHLYIVFDEGFFNTYKHLLGLFENQAPLNLGLRYYGFFGEPRDASVVIIFGITLLIFENYYLNKINNFKFHLFFAICALFATLSMTFILSLFFILPLILILNFKTFFDIKFLFCILILFFIALIFLYFSQRLQLYIFQFLVFYNFDNSLINLIPLDNVYTYKQLNIDKIKNTNVIPMHLSTQAISFQPIMEFINYFYNFEFLKFLFGNGLSTSLDFQLRTQNYLKDDFSPSYPPSQLTRILYEGGLICFLLWIYAFYNPLKKILSSNIDKHGSKLLFFVYLGLLSASLIHRSVTIFIMVGILINYHYIFQKNDLSNK
tara:strand:+ start:3407 stop:4831 length:1425 start_codon:yes stop_codon:yes gene_type:complete